MDKIIIPQEITEQIKNHFNEHLPEEACGILAGLGNKVSTNLPITNQSHSRVRYYMEPLELLRALELIESSGLELLVIYHSHPTGPDKPSETDIKEFLYPGAATIIGFTENGEWQLKAFIIMDATYEEINLETF